MSDLKRKGGAAVAEAPKKKAKKAKSLNVSKAPEAPAEPSPAPPVTVEPVSRPPKAKSSRKRAVDFMDGDDEVAEAATSKQSKKAKTKNANATTPAEPEAARPSQTKSATQVNGASKSKKSKKQAQDIVEAGSDDEVSQDDVDEVNGEQEEDGDEEEIDGGALLKGIDDEDDEDDAQDVNLDTQNTPALPNEAVVQAKLKAIKGGAPSDDERGTIYVGRIPHGFYETQMRAFFSQFGDITRLRLSRNKRTGASKHFAFIEFANAEVAKIAAETMNSYLMFGHILKCNFVPNEQLHPELWKGANKKFRIIPNTKLEGQKLAEPKTVDKWVRKAEIERERRQAKAQKLAAIGYEPPKSFTTMDVEPQLKRISEKKQKKAAKRKSGSVDDDAARQLLRENGEPSILEQSEDEIAAPPTPAIESAKPKKKAKKDAKEKAVPEKPVQEVAVAADSAKPRKKKGKSAK